MQSDHLRGSASSAKPQLCRTRVWPSALADMPRHSFGCPKMRNMHSLYQNRDQVYLKVIVRFASAVLC